MKYLKMILLISALIFTGCAGTGQMLQYGAQDMSERFFDETFDRAEDGTERVVAGVAGKLTKGGKHVTINHVRGCIDNVITRSDGGLINGRQAFLIEAGTAVTVSLKIGIPSDDKEILLIAKPDISRSGRIPAGCDRVDSDSEEFDWDYDYDDWKIRN